MNAVTLFEGNTAVVMNSKTGKTGSFARAIAFATREARMNLSLAVYAKWLENAQYRPIVNDILDSGLVAKAAVPYVAGFVSESGPVSKDAMINLCRNVDHAVRNKRNKDGEPVQLKGQKAFLYGIVQRLASMGDTIDA